MSTSAKLAWLTLVLAFGVVIFGAFVRLSNAGLSCPDWPTCYGQATWPEHAHEVARADAAFPDRPFEAHKAWREQVHRMLAGTLGVLVLSLALIAVWRQPVARWMMLGAAAAAAVGVVLYMRGAAVTSSVLAALAMLMPLLVAARLPRAASWRIAVLAFAVIVFQAMLGMWTVTLLLKPVVVLAHLLGGMLTFSLLAYIALRLTPVYAHGDEYRNLRRLIAFGIVLLGAQIALGGWTSANYAALACGAGDIAFPKCLNQWWPAVDFKQGFVLWRGIGVDYEGGVLDLAARTAIQMAHRFGAVVVAVYLGWLAFKLIRVRLLAFGIALGALLLAQILLGISNVHFALPLPVATAHNGVAALLLFALLAALARTQPRASSYTP